MAKEEGFQLFMALLDRDRFEGRFRDGVHTADVSDLMRRMVRERPLRFDSAPVFPEQPAHAVPYQLSDGEATLYRTVTAHVRDEFNRTAARQNDERAGTVAFALAILQRRLASSPEATCKWLGGRTAQREARRYEVTHVPAAVRGRDRLVGRGGPVLPRYERVAFEMSLIAPHGQPLTAFVCPGHPPLDGTIDLTLERHRDLLRRGAVLVDERDPGTTPRVLFALEHAVQDASVTPSGDRRVVSRRLLCMELDGVGHARHLHYAPYLDYCALTPDEPTVDALLASRGAKGISRALEAQLLAHAVATIVPEHLAEMRGRTVVRVDKTGAAVKERLTKEINYWDHRAEDLRLQEQAGRPNARLNSGEVRKRADALQVLPERRLDKLRLERQIAPLPPVVVGGVLVVPAGLLAAMGHPRGTMATGPVDTHVSAARARAVVMEVESQLGFGPSDRDAEKLGYHIESRRPDGGVRFIEIKGRVAGAATATVTRNEILYSQKQPDDCLLAIVEFLDDKVHLVHYVQRPFQREPDFGVTSVKLDFGELGARAVSTTADAIGWSL